MKEETDDMEDFDPAQDDRMADFAGFPSQVIAVHEFAFHREG